jgi:uncharacterized protein
MFNRLLIILVCCLAFLNGCSNPPEPTITLARAVSIGDLDQLERNLYWGADPNQTDSAGLTPLHVAAQKDSLVMSRILVRHQANLEAQDSQGYTPLLKALIARNTIIADFLVKSGARLEPDKALHITASLGSADRDVIDFLLKRGASLDSQDEDGNTPLHIAILNDQRVVVKYLINRGARLDISNKASLTPLALAIAQHKPNIERLLRQFGAQETY